MAYCNKLPRTIRMRQKSYDYTYRQITNTDYVTKYQQTHHLETRRKTT
jgi:hypothetical protein